MSGYQRAVPVLQFATRTDTEFASAVKHPLPQTSRCTRNEPTGRKRPAADQER